MTEHRARRRSAARVLPLLCALLVAGCGRGKEIEPNDHFTQATPITGKTRVEGTMKSAGDVDVFKLEQLRDGENLNLHVGGIRGADFVLSIQDRDRRELKRVDETSVGGDERLLDIGLDQGVYYIVLSDKGEAGADPKQRYVMTLEFSPSQGREREPNDKALQANVLIPGGMVRGHFFPSRNLLAEEEDYAEEDWFRINVNRDGRYLLNIDVSEVPGIDIVLEVYSPNSYKVGGADAGGLGDPEILRGFGIQGPVHYYLRVRSKAARGWNSQIPYQILTELVPYRGASEFEPNNQRLEATAFEGETIEGTLAPAGDEDWYKIEVSEEDRYLLTVELSGLAGMDARLRVADDIGRTIVLIDNLGKEQPEVLTGLGVSRGVYYLVVSEKSGKRSDPRRGYRLTKRIAAYQEGLEFEINDSSSAAQSIKVGRSIDGYIAPKGDTDWYEFNVYSQSDLVVELTGVLNVQLELTLFDQDVRPLETLGGRRPGEALTLTRRLEPGTYSLRLQASDPQHNNIRDKYTLRIRSQ